MVKGGRVQSLGSMCCLSHDGEAPGDALTFMRRNNHIKI